MVCVVVDAVDDRLQQLAVDAAVLLEQGPEHALGKGEVGAGDELPSVRDELIPLRSSVAELVDQRL